MKRVKGKKGKGKEVQASGKTKEASFHCQPKLSNGGGETKGGRNGNGQQ